MIAGIFLEAFHKDFFFLVLDQEIYIVSLALDCNWQIFLFHWCYIITSSIFYGEFNCFSLKFHRYWGIVDYFNFPVYLSFFLQLLFAVLHFLEISFY